MLSPKHFPLVGAFGLATFVGAMVHFLEWSARSSSETESSRVIYRLVDSQTNIAVGSWQLEEGRSTFTLRDGFAVPRVIIQADAQLGGMISIHDAKGQWHYYPAPPAE